MAQSDWQQWYVNPSNVGSLYWNEALSTVVPSSVPSHRWQSTRGFVGWIGYEGVDGGSLFPRASAVMRVRDYWATRDYFGFLMHQSSELSGSEAGGSVNGILVALTGRNTEAQTAQLQVFEVDGGVAGTPLATSANIGKLTLDPSWVQFEVTTLFNIRPSPAPPEVRTYYRKNQGSIPTTPGSGGWSGWILLHEHNAAANMPLFSALSSGSHLVSRVRHIPLNWSYSIPSEMYWDDVRIYSGTEI